MSDEFHLLACLGCCQAMVFFPFKLVFDRVGEIHDFRYFNYSKVELCITEK